ncbi:hypothetical protein CTI12_AA266860 [Artemisia annua]|uniref:Uncharacterized protein n=1 Tax=Artemisia annua TaxID=35608 RepID=A0A2U1NGU3_ARTAN|nr:hypothetical protein CTI12_AA266860 [Artemisia annua]
MDVQAPYLKKKAVFVTVYVEKPIKRGSSINKHIEKSKKGGWYNRRAELLSYSHRLRELPKSTGASSSPHQSESLVVSTTKKQPSSPQIILSQEKPKVKKHQGCFEWVSMFKFCNTNTKTTTKNTKKVFLSKVMAPIQKYR